MIRVNEPLLNEAAIENVLRCLKDGWISGEGPFVQEFERRWAAECGMAHGVAVCNGTAALELAVETLELQPGDEVILPTFTIASCVLAVLEAGAVPVLVDSDPETWCMDADQVEARISRRTRAIMPVHIYGHPVDMDPICALADRHGLTVVEDAAEAHGAEYRGRPAGSLGDLSCFSFYANKIITTGEGGMVLTNDAAFADRLRAGRNLGFQTGRRFRHQKLGHNYRLTNMQAALGIAQVDALRAHIDIKRTMAARYLARLRKLSMLQLPVERPWAKNVYWMFAIVLSDEVPFDAATLATRLAALEVETRPFFLGMHEQPALRPRFDGEHYPVAERIARRGLYLPSGLALTREQQDQVCDALEHALVA